MVKQKSIIPYLKDDDYITKGYLDYRFDVFTHETQKGIKKMFSGQRKLIQQDFKQHTGVLLEEFQDRLREKFSKG